MGDSPLLYSRRAQLTTHHPRALAAFETTCRARQQSWVLRVRGKLHLRAAPQLTLTLVGRLLFSL